MNLAYAGCPWRSGSPYGSRNGASAGAFSTCTRSDCAVGPWVSREVGTSRVRTLGLPCSSGPAVPGSRGVYQCPADQELSASVGSSYDWRDTGNPNTTLAGQPITDVRERNSVLVFDAMPNWHAKNKMNAARVDGSVETVDEQVCLEDLTHQIRRVTTQK